jgi:hypothetical protein
VRQELTRWVDGTDEQQAGEIGAHGLEEVVATRHGFGW